MGEAQAPTGAFQPAAELVITSLETLKVFSDPLRQQIIEALLGSPRTAKQLAVELDLAQTKLYYHINLLEEHNLIAVSGTRVVSGIIEKQYAAAAESFRIDQALLTPGQSSGDQGLDAALATILDRTIADIRVSLRHGAISTDQSLPRQRRMLLMRAISRLTDAQAAEFYDRLEALLDEFDRVDLEPPPAGADTRAYGLTIAVYPSLSQSTRPDDSDDE